MAKKSGTLIVRSNPSGATVTIEDACKITPAIFDLKCKTQPYNIIIEKTGHDDYFHKVIVQEDTRIEINAILDKTKK